MPVLGGQAAFGILGVPGNVGIGIDATLMGPRAVNDNRTTFGDVYYQGSLKWNLRATFPSHTIVPVSSTLQMQVSLTDTSNPAKWSMLRFSF